MKIKDLAKKLIFVIMLFFGFVSFAQKKELAAANQDFTDKKFMDAEANYRVADSKDPKKPTAAYNLGNAIYRINQIQEAGLAYLKSFANAKSRPEKHQAMHNLGNVFMKAKDYTNAVKVYKQALVNNPSDEETRYNYALAKKLLKENPPKSEDKKKDKDKDKKDPNKDKKEDKKDGEGKDPKQDQQNQGQPKPVPQGISKDRVQNLLDAVNNEERKIQDKVNKSKQKAKPVQTEKDW